MTKLITALVLGLASTMAFANDPEPMNCPECCKTMCKSDMSCCKDRDAHMSGDAKTSVVHETATVATSDVGTKPAVRARQGR
jgi:hypothetical protein